MKFKLADLPINVIDGFDHIFNTYPNTALISSGFVSGVLSSAIFFGEWSALVIGAVIIFGALILAYFVGRK